MRKDLLLSLYFFLVVFCFSIELNTPIIFYGTQFFGVSLLVLLRLIFYPKISISKIYFIVFLLLIWEGLVYLQTKSTLYSDLFINSQKSIFLFFSMYLIYDLIDVCFKRESLLKAINLCILLFGGIVVFQFFSFYFLGIPQDRLDFSIILGGGSSRSGYIDELYRPTSLMPEPAIFVGVQIALLVLQYLLNKHNNLIRVFGLVSVLISMSFAGILLVFLYATLVYVQKIKNIIFYAISVFVASIYLSDIFGKRLDSISSGGDGSNNVKIEILNYFLSDANHIFLGYGNIMSSKSTPLFFEGATDLTFLFTSLAVFGVFIGSLILISFGCWLVRSSYSIREKFLILLPLIKLTNPGVIFFSCFIFLIIAINKQRNKL